jgi:hypothetical protein
MIIKLSTTDFTTKPFILKKIAKFIDMLHVKISIFLAMKTYVQYEDDKNELAM